MVTDTYAYTAFGELLNQTGSTVNAYLYTGQQFDAPSGLYGLRARYYDPRVGRYLGRDPEEINPLDPRQLNRYVYAANDPIRLSDPSGMLAVETALQDSQSAVPTQMVATLGNATAGALAMMYLTWLVREPVRAPAIPSWPDTTNPNPGEDPSSTAWAVDLYQLGLNLAIAMQVLMARLG